MHSAAPNQLLALAYTGVVTTGCAVWLQNVALKDVSAAEMALLFSTIPLWAAAFSALALAEHVGVSVALGGTLIVAACVVGRGQGGE